MTIIHGHCDPRFEPVKQAFAQNFSARDEIGASVALSFEGEMVVDLWAGQLAKDSEDAWVEDTIVNVWSTTKPMAAMCLLLLADKGELDLYAPAARYWPEFAQAGKDDVTIAHMLSHQAGLSGMDAQVEGDAIYDWDWMTKALAAQEPWWEPGSQSGYHALTQGFLLGEIVRRITGQSLGTFFKHEIADPLDADFQIGVADETKPRIANLTPPPSTISVPDDGSIAARTFANPRVDIEATFTDAWREAEIPAANGHSNARGVVRVQTAMANGGFANGRQLLSDAGTKRIFEEQARGVDLVLGIPTVLGLGYGLNNDDMPIAPNPHVCYWGGYGGSVVIVDQDARMCLSYVMNRMEQGLTGDERGLSLAMGAYQSLMAMA